MPDAIELDLEAEIKKWLRGRKTAVSAEMLLYLVGLEYLRGRNLGSKRGRTNRARSECIKAGKGGPTPRTGPSS